MDSGDILSHNKNAWNKSVKDENRWTIPVTNEALEGAQKGEWSVVLTPVKHVPESWLPKNLSGLKILGLASGGGQQGPLFAAAGGDVTIVDISPCQLDQDRKVCSENQLPIQLVESPADDLSMFEDQSFDIVFNPVSSCFFPDLAPVWKECHRVLKKGGVFMSGFLNPVMYLFDFEVVLSCAG